MRRAETEWHRDAELVWGNANGAVMHDGNLRNRILRPAAKAAGVPCMGFHTLRHGFASMLIEQGRTTSKSSASSATPRPASPWPPTST